MGGRITRAEKMVRKGVPHAEIFMFTRFPSVSNVTAHTFLLLP